MLPETAGGVGFFSSPLLAGVGGVKHAFPCKSGAADEPLDDLRNRLKTAFSITEFLTVEQTHGTDVLIFDGTPASAGEYRSAPFDAVITSTRGLAAGVRTADCLPILMAACDRAVAALHGGWKGLLNGIVEKTVEKLARFAGIEKRAIVASIGPHICRECYEVGPDVAGPFSEKFGGQAGGGRGKTNPARPILRRGDGDRSHLDLDAAAREALEMAGVAPQNIDSAGQCTRCSPDLFYSYRRDGGPTGRQLSFIFIE